MKSLRFRRIINIKMNTPYEESEGKKVFESGNCRRFKEIVPIWHLDHTICTSDLFSEHIGLLRSDHLVITPHDDQ